MKEGMFAAKQGTQINKSSPWVFPKNPNDLLKDLPRDAQGRIYTSQNLRIRPEKHAFEKGEIWNPRHHGQHYHVETRLNPSGSWKKENRIILKPKGYKPGDGTGFLPGEFFPGI